MKFALCKHCGTEVYNDDYVYNGYVCCEDCFKEANATETLIEYIKAYPNRFIEYLVEEALIQENSVVIDILEDYKEWQQEFYDEWVMN